MPDWKDIIRYAVVCFDRLFANKRILVLGDSHARVFMYPTIKRYFPLIKFDVCAVFGATASGLENPNSKTQAYKQFRERLREAADGQYDKIVVMLGEVDTGFVIWYRAHKYGSGVEEMLNEALEKYCRFIEETHDICETLVVSTPLPTISDSNNRGEIANLRREVQTSQKDRTALTLEFNRRVRQFCTARGIEYLSLDDASIGSDGLVDRRLLNRNPNDHHYDKIQYVRLLGPKMKQLAQ